MVYSAATDDVAIDFLKKKLVSSEEGSTSHDIILVHGKEKVAKKIRPLHNSSLRSTVRAATT